MTLPAFARAVSAFLQRELRERLSYRALWVLDGVAIAAHVVVYYFIAKLFAGGPNPWLARYGGAYFPFALSGIAFSHYHQSSLTGLAAALESEQAAGTLEAIWMTPAGLWGVLAAAWSSQLLWTSARVAAYLAVGALAFGFDLSRADPLSCAAVLVLTLSALSGLGLLSAAFLLVYKRGDPVSATLDGATRVLSGVYFPVALLPAWLQRVAWLSPFTFALEAFRKALLQGAPAASLARELGTLALWSAVALPAGLWVFGRSIDRARRDGSLAFR